MVENVKKRLKRWIPNQKVAFFLQNALSFGLIFLTLGFLIVTVITTTAYNQIDNRLVETAKRAEVHRTPLGQIMVGQPSVKASAGLTIQRGDATNQDSPVISMQTQVIFWSSEHEQMTAPSDINQARVAEQIQFSKLTQGKIEQVSYKDSYENKQYFHSYLCPFYSAELPGVAYIQVLTNTNQVTESTNHMLNIVELSLFGFYLISLGVSFYLARLQMGPILTSWNKQQRFVENASHELRTPLSIIQNKLETLFTKPEMTILESSEEISDSLGEIRRLRQLTSDLLLLTRGDNAQVIEKESFDLLAFSEKLVNSYREIAEINEKTITLETFFKEDSSTVLTDKKKIHQLLVILLDNALKYTATGGEITLSVSLTKDIEFSVRDNGVGILDEKKTVIFERFVRVDDSRNKHTGGFGLGLSIAKQIVDTLGGKILVLDNVPKGTVFKVILPK